MLPLFAAFNSHWEPLVWFALGILGAVGVVAVLDPRRVTVLAMREHGWVESPKSSAGIDGSASRRLVALSLCRLGGVAIFAAVAASAYFLARR